jgi:hypothetical protein
MATVRIQFELSEDEYEAAKPFILDEKYRHYWARQAFNERVNRSIGYDKKARVERLKNDAAYIQEMINAGLVKINK